MNEPKAVLQRYLQAARDALLWKLDGLTERDARLPRTPTGTNLLGLVTHAANVEIGYFGDTFGRDWPTAERVTDADFDLDPNADLYATANESLGSVVDFYRRVWAFADETIRALPLDAVGRVPWWPDDRAEVTLQRVMVHVTSDLARHAGHADVLRELIDGAAGLNATNSNLPHDVDWSAHVARLTELAHRF